MKTPVTLEILFVLLGVVIAFVAANWVYTWKGDDVLHARLSNQGRHLDAYKLEVAHQYASIDHLKEVELRLAKAIDGLSLEVRELNGLLRNQRPTCAPANPGFAD